MKKPFKLYGEIKRGEYKGSELEIIINSNRPSDVDILINGKPLKIAQKLSLIFEIDTPNRFILEGILVDEESFIK